LGSNRILTKEEIDTIMRNLRDTGSEDSQKAQPYDFRRPDRIAKDQLRSIHLLHDNFARSLGSSLSAYMRAYVIVNLVSVEQLSFAEFAQCLPSPTLIVTLGMRPFDGNAVLELNPSLVYPLLEMMLGGNGKSPSKVSREVTEIERSILDGVFRIVLHDLKEAWSAVSQINFNIEAHETEPQLLQTLAPNEAVVAIGIEIRVGENSGMMNIGIPSIIIKMLRQKFDQQWSLRRTEATEEEHTRILNLLKPTEVFLDSRLEGPKLEVEDLLRLETGDVLRFDFALERPLSLLVNGTRKFQGHIVAKGNKKAFQVDSLIPPVHS
jgi:flagellar motor switch protein FliM